jgi:pimeloyl-ACP methyl ester carboxylesterase
MKIKAHYLLLTVLLLFGLSHYSYADNPSSNCNITSHEIALDSGILHYNLAGAGPSILLLHGLFASKEQWDSVLCLLSASGYTAIAPDLPGYGKSTDFPIMDYKLENQVARLRQFMDRLGMVSFDLAGNSMGGAIAALYIQKYPQQVRTLAFIGSPLGIIEWSPQVREAIYQGINPFIPVDGSQLDLELSLLLVNPPTLPEDVKKTMVADYVERNRHYQQVWTIVSLYDAVLDPPRFWLQAPTLILWGEADQIFAIDGATLLRQRFPRGKLVRLPNAGHLLHFENAEETTAIYLDFLRIYSMTRSWGR